MLEHMAPVLALDPALHIHFHHLTECIRLLLFCTMWYMLHIFHKPVHHLSQDENLTDSVMHP